MNEGYVIVKLTKREAAALFVVAMNGYGDGDFSVLGFGAAIEKLQKARRAAEKQTERPKRKGKR